MTRAHPRILVAAAVQRHGEQAVVDWCVRLLTDRERPDEEDVRLLGGSEDWQPYWRRVWGARGLLYVWGAGAVPALEDALADEHWRVREMALKVVRAHVPQQLLEPATAPRDDPHPRVRAAAERAVVTLTRTLDTPGRH